MLERGVHRYRDGAVDVEKQDYRVKRASTQIFVGRETLPDRAPEIVPAGDPQNRALENRH
jgi:hypothetical protein